MTANTTTMPAFAVNDFDSSKNKAWWGRYGGIVLVIGFHVVLLWFVLSDFAKSDLKITQPPASVVIQDVAIPAAPVPPPAPPPPVPPPPVPPPPAAQPAPPPPAPNALQVKPKLPVVQSPKAVASSAPAVSAESSTATATATPSQNQVTAPNAQSLEADYVRKVQGMLNSTKRYPTGRQASQERPQGKVRIVFVLNRSGALQTAKVQESSNSNLLDDSALAGVRRATYPGFDADLWKGQETHEFSVDIDFLPPGIR